MADYFIRGLTCDSNIREAVALVIIAMALLMLTYYLCYQPSARFFLVILRTNEALIAGLCYPNVICPTSLIEVKFCMITSLIMLKNGLSTS